MLSYIYQTAHYFEKNHGIRPNALYLNREHFNKLRYSFSDPDNIEAITQHLGMQLILSNDALHPHMAHLQSLSETGQWMSQPRIARIRSAHG